VYPAAIPYSYVAKGTNDHGVMMSIFPTAISDTDHLDTAKKIEIEYSCVAWPATAELHTAVSAPL